MGLGFVVARFGLFLRQLALQHPGVREPNAIISGAIGIALVAGGVLAAALSAIRFFRTRTQIDTGTFEPELFTEVAVIIVTILGGVALVIYLAISQ
jgi:putative membrane protein